RGAPPSARSGAPSSGASLLLLLFGRLRDLSLDSARLLRLFHQVQLPVLAFLQLHSEVEIVVLEELPDLLERLHAEVVDVQHLLLGPLHEVGERDDVLLLQGVHRPHRELRQVLDGPPEQVTQRQRHNRKSTRLNSSHVKISYAVFCLKKKNQKLLEPLLSREAN